VGFPEKGPPSARKCRDPLALPSTSNPGVPGCDQQLGLPNTRGTEVGNIGKDSNQLDEVWGGLIQDARWAALRRLLVIGDGGGGAITGDAYRWI
jgi:hypothetical protein